MDIAKGLCICGDSRCTGCDCGMDCTFSPGHTQGTSVLSPFAAMIEATERLLARENEEMYLFSPGLRRLRATLAFAKRHQNQSQSESGQDRRATPVYSIQYQQDNLPVTSITGFDAAAMTLLIWELTRLSNTGEVIPLADKTSGLPPFHHYSELRKEIAEKVIPDERDEAGLVALLSFDTSFLSRRIAFNDEEKDKEETTATSLLHRGLAEHVEAVLEERWDTCVGLSPMRHSNLWATCIELLSNS